MLDKYPALARIPAPILQGLNDTLEMGAEKHGENFLDKDRDYYIGAMRRHLTKLENGQVRCAEDGQRHTEAVLVRAIQIAADELKAEGAVRVQEVVNVQNLKCHPISGSTLPVCRTGCG